MAFTSAAFAVFTALGLAAYYAVPKRYRYGVLLLLSYAFYLSYGWQILWYLLFTTITTYGFARWLGADIPTKEGEREQALKIRRRRRKNLLCGSCLVLNFGLLYFVKYWNFTLDLLQVPGQLLRVDLLLPLGISFYIFQSMGYLIDVKRGKTPPETNIARLALFVSFFPQLVQGPIGRYDRLAPTLFEGNDFSFDNLKEGGTLVFWGLVKKLCIADRAAIAAASLLDGETEYGGGLLLCGILLYCVQLYCDFSGGIDIARGVGRLFGVEMAQNFRRPLFSRSLAEFWRRWHITLGAWLKDYLFYPLTLSKPFIKIGKFTRKHIKGSAGKILPTSLVTFIVYFVIGIWHGANWKYVLFGCYNGVIITASLLLEPRFETLRKRMGAFSSSRLYGALCMLRTCVIVVIGRYITRAADVPDAMRKFSALFTDFRPEQLTAENVLSLGLSGADFAVIGVGLLLLFAVEWCEEYGERLSVRIEKKGTAAVFAAAFVMLTLFLLFGVFRGDYIASEFIYKQF